MVLCIFGASAPLGFVIGAVASSLLATRASWPWTFWLLAIVCFLLVVMSVVILPGAETSAISSHPMKINPGDKIGLWHRLDGYGIILGVSGLALFNFAWN